MRTLLLFVLALSLAGCGSTPSTPTPVTLALKILVRISAGHHITPEGVSFSGTTNLPEDTQLLLRLYSGDGPIGQAYVAVSQGKFESERFRDSGEALILPQGTYDVRITMPMADMQPPSVKLLLGEDSANLYGPLVTETRMQGRIVHIVEWWDTFTVK
jgi:hypothetical protein